MSEEKLLDSYVQFSAAGIESVMSAAQSMVDKLQTIEAAKTIVFAASGVGAVEQGLAKIQEQVSALGDRKDLEFAAGGLSEMSAALEEVRQKMAAMDAKGATAGLAALESSIATMKGKLAGVDPGKTPEINLAVKGLAEVESATAGIREKLAGISSGKASEIKFTASGEEKVDKAVGKVKQKLAQIAQGGDLSHLVSSTIEDAFKTSGSNIGEALAAGIGGMVGGAIGATIGSQLSSLVLNLPKIATDQVEQHRDASTLKNRSLTAEEAEAWRGVSGSGRAFWSHFSVGKNKEAGADVFEQIAVEFQRQAPVPKDTAQAKKNAEQAYAMANRLMALSVYGELGDPTGIAEQMGQMMSIRSPKMKSRFAQNDFVFEALEEVYGPKGYTADQIRAAVAMPDSKKGAITTDELIAAMGTKLNDPRLQKDLQEKLGQFQWNNVRETGVRAWAGPNQLSSLESEYLDELKNPSWNPFSSAESNANNNRERLAKIASGESLRSGIVWGEKTPLTREQITRLEQLARGERGELFSMPGFSGNTLTPHDLASAAKGGQYEFTSLAGLAEKMQTMASQNIEDHQRRTADALEAIQRDGIAIKDRGTPGTPSHSDRID